MRFIKKKTLCICVAIFIILLILLHPGNHGHTNYEYINKDFIESQLYAKTITNLTNHAVLDCEYSNVIFEKTTMISTFIDVDAIESNKIKEGGEYIPSYCRPKFSVAIIVPYRDRAEQLHSFLVYMHMFLQQQNIHYRIFIIEQMDLKAFNRAKLLNVGALTAIKAEYPCLILHDVDLLPLHPANIYACTIHPRHLSVIIPKFRFVLPYLNLSGGVLAILSKQYKDINGMSNQYFGWGGEDDDLSIRLEAHGLKLCRFEPETSQYHMLEHKPHPKGWKTNELLGNAKERMYSDGLNSLEFTEIDTVLHPLFTHVMVEL